MLRTSHKKVGNVFNPIKKSVFIILLLLYNKFRRKLTSSYHEEITKK